jgi:drug/metabolite transporter (DMT)-like permease
MVIKQLGAVQTTNYVYVIPVVTLIASSFYLNETVTVFALIGMFCTLTGVFLAQKSQ